MNDEVRQLRDEMRRLRRTAPAASDLLLATVAIGARLTEALPHYSTREVARLACGHARVMIAELPELATRDTEEPMTLLDLAEKFDALPAADIEARIALAEQMKPLLGAHAGDFDARHEALLAQDPEHPAPATATICQMGAVIAPARPRRNFLENERADEEEPEHVPTDPQIVAFLAALTDLTKRTGVGIGESCGGSSVYRLKGFDRYKVDYGEIGLRAVNADNEECEEATQPSETPAGTADTTTAGISAVGTLIASEVSVQHNADGSVRAFQSVRPVTVAEIVADPAGASPLHPRGGPLPNLPPGLHPRLPFIIQEARGRLVAGDEWMIVARHVAEEAAPRGLGARDLEVAIGYLLKSADSRARTDLLRAEREARAAAPPANQASAVGEPTSAPVAPSIIQQAIDRLIAGSDPALVGEYVAAQALGLSIGSVSLGAIIGSLLKAAEGKGRTDLLAEQAGPRV